MDLTESRLKKHIYIHIYLKFHLRFIDKSVQLVKVILKPLSFIYCTTIMVFQHKKTSSYITVGKVSLRTDVKFAGLSTLDQVNIVVHYKGGSN